MFYFGVWIYGCGARALTPESRKPIIIILIIWNKWWVKRDFYLSKNVRVGAIKK